MDTPNPVTELTENERVAVRENWKKMATNWKTTGVEFFIRLFQRYPVTRTFFKTFNDMSIEEIRKSSKLRAHAINFKHGITSFVDNLDDMDCLVVLIEKLTANHFRRQIKVEQFQDAFSLFIELAKEMSDSNEFKGQKESDDNEFPATAWKKTMAVVANVIGEHMKALEQQTDGE